MESGDTIGKYRLVRPLGRGGMGEVWLATASGCGGFAKTVVLKTLLPELARDRLFIEMLSSEARICAKLSHPNLIEVFDFTEQDGVYLLAMEYVAGHPLHHIMKMAQVRKWHVPPWFALRVAWECCHGLQCAHDQGVIHCDLSPSNVMVTFTGTTKILDFGVAHSLARGPKADRLKGKFPYMAPERIKSLATDRRTDIYSLGVMLYLLFTGRLPFDAANDGELLHKIVTQAPAPPSTLRPVPPEIELIILRAIQPDPGARFQTAGELLLALSPCLEGQLGTYGQQDVASFVTTLFEVPPIPRPPRLASGTREDALDDEITRRPEPREPARPAAAHADDQVSIVVEIESSDLEVPNEPTPAPPPASAGLVSSARGSSEIKPLTTSLAAVFGSVPSPRERTSVQSLFGELPALSLGPSRVFDRPPLAASAAEDNAPADPIDGGWFDAEPAHDAEQAEPERPRGVFDRYSSPRSPAVVHWPWPSSRSKSD